MTKTTILLGAAIWAACLGAAREARACDYDSTACTLKGHPDARMYWGSATPFGVDRADDPRCTNSLFGVFCHLSGYLYKPDTVTANMPAVVYVHGSGSSRDQQSQCEIINYFIEQGYVVWAPDMRGVSDTTCLPGTSCVTPSILNDPTRERFKNTGVDVVTLAGTGDDREPRRIDALQDEVVDIDAALTWLVGLAGPSGGTTRLVDPTKIALLGHSYGGVLVTFSAAQALSHPPAVVASLSGGALQWDNSPLWSVALTSAALGHREPIYFHQTTNEGQDGSTDSTLLPFLSADANPAGGGSQMAIFSRVPIASSVQTCCDSSGKTGEECAHQVFNQNRTQVQRWIRGVRDFMVHYHVD